MNYQAIYNATYNYFAGKKYWPEHIPYNADWEFSCDRRTKYTYELGRTDEIIKKLKMELNIETVDSKMIEDYIDNSREIKRR